MTWSMFGMVTSISMLWISTKGPQFGVLIARREFESLDREFFRAARLSVLIAALGAALVWLGLFLLAELRFPLAARILSPLPAGCLAVAVILTSLSIATSVYLRAHAKEPLTVPSLVQASLLASLAMFCAPRFGVVGTAVSYLGVVGLVGMPWSILIWVRCREAWHAPTASLSLSETPDKIAPG
jgi:hypothetical protein